MDALITSLVIIMTYLIILFGCHLVTKEPPAHVLTSRGWYAGDTTEPTHDLCMAITATLITGIALFILLYLAQSVSYLRASFIMLGIVFFAAHASYRFVEWYTNESSR